MAYTQDENTVKNALQTSSSEVFDTRTLNSITSVLPTNIAINQIAVPATSNEPVVFADGSLNFVDVSNVPTGDSALVLSISSGVVILGGSGGANLIVGNPNDTVVSGGAAVGTTSAVTTTAAPVQHAAAWGVVERVIVGTAFADKIQIADDINTNIVIGDGDTVVAGSGYDTVTAAQGDSTVTGGSNYTIVRADGKVSDYTVTVDGTHVKIHSAVTGVDVDMAKIQYVELENKQALVFAADGDEAAVAALYNGVFGRYADANGLKFYFQALDRGATINAIAADMLNSVEYKNSAGVVNNFSFLTDLYKNILGRTGSTDEMAHWNTQLANGVSRADVAAAFAETAGTQLETGTGSEASIVAGIKVVDGII